MKIFKVLFIAILLQAFNSYGQNTINGFVENENGEALQGAHVLVFESYQYAVTDNDGAFQIQNVKGKQALIEVRYLGYESIQKKIALPQEKPIRILMSNSAIMVDEYVVTATRAQLRTPVTQSTLNKSQIGENTKGRDIPYTLKSLPAVVSSSDAGHGVGYTDLKVRGTDMSRINITVNGIPLNDSESHGVWWVNMPDFASSLHNIQLQRGVGTSTNGAAAFGASINLQTQKMQADPYAIINTSGGSFNTLKNNIAVGTGLLNNHFTFDARLSNITSDGFIDRASAKMSSYFLSGAYYAKNTMIKANVISGTQKTYQAWNGIPKVRLDSDTAGMQRYADHWLLSQSEVDHMIGSNARTYNLYTYANETDNYKQDHYQLFLTHRANSYNTFNAAFHYTRGLGYYEQQKLDEKFNEYALPDYSYNGVQFSRTDLIRQKWLDNHFYGGVASLTHQKRNLTANIGGGWNKYIGDHYGKIIWAQFINPSDINHQWYFNNGTKTDANIYTKAEYDISKKLMVYGDLQVRFIDYAIEGIHDDLRDLTQDHNYTFFNPKAGLAYQIRSNQRVFVSYAVANREPSRSGFRDADPNAVPEYETLYDLEAGYGIRKNKFAVQFNAYWMNYNNQLVLNGEINNVGDPIFINVDKSYRIGAELEFNSQLSKRFVWDLSLNLSKNKIASFNSYVDDWDNGGQIEEKVENADIAFSPSIVAHNSFRYVIIPGDLDIKWDANFVGKQFIDNTMNEDRMLDAYFVNDLSLSYHLRPAKTSGKNKWSIDVFASVINFLDHEYETNAWVYRYFLGGSYYEMDGYFPQAGRHFLVGLQINI